jgi:hypothetical protein
MPDPQPTPETEEDVAGVQGDAPEDDKTAPADPLEDTPIAPAPDAAEIEWAGGAIKRPPHPAN